MSHLSHLRTFLEAYRSGSFSKAAELLGITQPAASQHIQSLETLVGKRLFIRQARGVTATEAADELARSVSPFIDGLEEKLSSFRSGSVRGGTINLAGPPDFIHSRLGTVMAPLMKEGIAYAFIPAINNVFIPFCMTGAPISLLPHLCLMTVCTAMHIY